MHLFGSHTFSFINASNERYWVKFHFKTQQGIKNLTDQQACELVGQDRESSQRDLFEAIENKDFPRWTMYVQIMPEKDASTYHLNPFDLTKVWPKRSEEHTSELQSLMRISYAVFCLKKKKQETQQDN